MRMNFLNKNILITGASSGIGLQLAKDLANVDCTLILTARRYENLLNIRQELNHKSAKIIIYKNNVAEKQDVRKVYSAIKENMNKIDIAFLNAGTNSKLMPDAFSAEDAEITYGANLFGIIYWAELLIKEMKSRNDGMIIGVTSLADARGFSKNGFYSSSKVAASTLLESMRVDLIKHNIKVITVKPGFVRTPMTAANNFYMPFLMNVETASKIILSGIKKEKRVIRFPFLTTAGTVLLKLTPNFIYDRLSVGLRNSGEKLKENEKSKNN
ncbi:MAG: SDR family NAD(P)-dependent oxidoreductase [Ignavibacteriaceae bacterium]|nr:SDR family NAD(P)-dependent oxidoreductase [Ignavibacteriaceae bacterium]